jgi:hypothetical protein
MLAHRPGMTMKRRHAAQQRRVLRCSKGFMDTLLTSNGIPAFFSVMVRLT